LASTVIGLACAVNDGQGLPRKNLRINHPPKGQRMNPIDRRSFVKVLSAATAPLLLPACGGNNDNEATPALYPRQASANPLGFVGELQNGFEAAYEPTVTGQLPAGLAGTFYRNGPGIYSRGSERKGSIADGDGMIRMYSFSGGKVSYRSRFVRTEKFVEEQAAGRFLYTTWTSPQPPNGKRLEGDRSPNQAGVTTVVRNGKLYAHDEANPPWTLDPLTLESKATDNIGVANPYGMKAHFRVDAKTDEWILFDTDFDGQAPSHSAYIVSADGKKTTQRKIAVGANVPLSYMHDFFVSGANVMLHLQPAVPDFEKLARGVPFGTSLAWQAAQGTQLAILSRAGDVAPTIVETDSRWMWHSVNAYDRGNEIVADFVGYDAPDHFINIDGQEPAWYAYMQGRNGSYVNPGKLRRLVVNKTTKRATEEILDSGNNEFPVVDKRVHCHEHRDIYFIQAPAGALWWSRVVRFDARTGASDGYDFGPGYYLNEPSFAADTTQPVSLAARDVGWLLVPVFELATGVSSLAIFRANAMADGPIASVRLQTHEPFAFHGAWQQA
jgi:all-trans-8'-apo-beta-carotenal 15,15'-oxygenase